MARKIVGLCIYLKMGGHGMIALFFEINIEVVSSPMAFCDYQLNI